MKNEIDAQELKTQKLTDQKRNKPRILGSEFREDYEHRMCQKVGNGFQEFWAKNQVNKTN